MENQYKKLFNYVFILLSISGIQIIPKPPRIDFQYCIKIITLLCINILIYAFHLLHSIRLYQEPKFLFMGATDLCMIAMAFFLRAKLYFHIKNLRILAKKMNYLYEKVNRGYAYNKLYWMHFWVITSTFICILKIIFIVLNHLRNVPTINIIDGQKAFNNLLFIIYSITIVLWHLVPINAFAIYYILICHQLKIILSKFAKFTDSPINYKLEALYELYSKIRHGSTIIDDSISFYVLFVFMYLSGITNAALYVFLSPEIYKDIYQNIPVYILFVLNLFIFFGIISSASDVHETSVMIADNIDAVFEDNQISKIDYLLLFRSVNKQMVMTISGVLPIKPKLEMFSPYLMYCLLIFIEMKSSV